MEIVRWAALAVGYIWFLLIGLVALLGVVSFVACTVGEVRNHLRVTEVPDERPEPSNVRRLDRPAAVELGGCAPLAGRAGVRGEAAPPANTPWGVA